MLMSLLSLVCLCLFCVCYYHGRKDEEKFQKMLSTRYEKLGFLEKFEKVNRSLSVPPIFMPYVNYELQKDCFDFELKENNNGTNVFINYRFSVENSNAMNLKIGRDYAISMSLNKSSDLKELGYFNLISRKVVQKLNEEAAIECVFAQEPAKNRAPGTSGIIGEVF